SVLMLIDHMKVPAVVIWPIMLIVSEPPSASWNVILPPLKEPPVWVVIVSIAWPPPVDPTRQVGESGVILNVAFARTFVRTRSGTTATGFTVTLLLSSA